MYIKAWLYLEPLSFTFSMIMFTFVATTCSQKDSLLNDREVVARPIGESNI